MGGNVENAKMAKNTLVKPHFQRNGEYCTLRIRILRDKMILLQDENTKQKLISPPRY